MLNGKLYLNTHLTKKQLAWYNWFCPWNARNALMALRLIHLSTETKIWPQQDTEYKHLDFGSLLKDESQERNIKDRRLSV